MSQIEILDGELIIDISNNNIPVLCFNGTVNDSYITIIDASFNHRIAFHLAIECCFWIPNQITIEIQCLMAVIISWRWKSGFDARSELKLQFLLKVTLYDLNVCHYLSVCSINWNLPITPPQTP